MTDLVMREVGMLLEQMAGALKLTTRLLYGTGMRLLEGLRLQVKDVDFEMRQITVRDSKGAKDRVTMLSQTLVEPLRIHLTKVRALHQEDLATGLGEVWLPNALAVSLPSPPTPCDCFPRIRPLSL